MHHIQIKILQQLLYADSLNYAAMRPTGVESNHFAYHLEQLIRDGMVAKDGKVYRLTPKGTTFVDGLSQEKMTPRQQPFINTAIDLITPAGKTLLFRRNFNPYFRFLGFPMGKLHLEESVATAAARELEEKAGLRGIALIHRGMVYVEGRKNGQRISTVLYHIFHGEVAEELPTVTPPHRGECFWADHTSLPARELMPGFLQIKALLASQPELFFAEITQDIGGGA